VGHYWVIKIGEYEEHGVYEEQLARRKELETRKLRFFARFLSFGRSAHNPEVEGSNPSPALIRANHSKKVIPFTGDDLRRRKSG
jgi:hypothetical protein